MSRFGSKYEPTLYLSCSQLAAEWEHRKAVEHKRMQEEIALIAIEEAKKKAEVAVTGTSQPSPVLPMSNTTVELKPLRAISNHPTDADVQEARKRVEREASQFMRFTFKE